MQVAMPVILRIYRLRGRRVVAAQARAKLKLSKDAAGKRAQPTSGDANWGKSKGMEQTQMKRKSLPSQGPRRSELSWKLRWLA